MPPCWEPGTDAKDKVGCILKLPDEIVLAKCDNIDPQMVATSFPWMSQIWDECA